MSNTKRTELIADLRLNHEYCPKESILKAADMLEADAVRADKRVDTIAADRQYWREQAQQVAVPMTEEHIYELAKRITKEDAAPFGEVAARPGWAGFVELVRAIEAHHKIGVNK